MRGLRTIPVMIEMANEMAELCPEALLLNYTNPMAMVPWGIWAGSRWPAANTIGVCHSVRDTHSFLAEIGRRARGADRVPDGGVQPPVLRLRVPRSSERRRPLPRVCARSSRPTPRVSAAASAWRSSGGSATSPPSPASTRASTCRGSCTIPIRWSASAARSTSTSAAATRTSRSGRRLKSSWLDAAEDLEIEPNNELASQFIYRAGDRHADRALRQRAQRRADRRAARPMRASRCRCWWPMARCSRGGSDRSRRSASASTARS